MQRIKIKSNQCSQHSGNVRNTKDFVRIHHLYPNYSDTETPSAVIHSTIRKYFIRTSSNTDAPISVWIPRYLSIRILIALIQIQIPRVRVFSDSISEQCREPFDNLTFLLPRKYVVKRPAINNNKNPFKS